MMPPVWHPFWRQRSDGRSGSVVQRLMTRELGLPNYSGGAEVVSSFSNETAIGRNLVMSRIKSENLHEIPPRLRLRGEKMPDGKLTEGYDFSRFSVGWVKVEMDRKSKLTLLNGVFWESESLTVGRIRHHFDSQQSRDSVDRFYVIPPDFRRGFRQLGQMSRKSAGKLADVDVLYEGVRLTTVKTRQSSYLIILSDCGYIRLYDLLHGRSTGISLKSSALQSVKYAHLAVDSYTEEIRVLATINGKTTTVYVLKYLNELNQLRIDFILHLSFPVKMELSDSMVILGAGKYVDICTWKSLVSNAEPTEVKITESQDPKSNCSDIHEHIIKQPPQSLRRIKTQDSYLGFSTSLWPPQYYTRESKGRDVTTAIKQLSTEEVIWYITSCPLNDAKFSDFPDDSPRFLFCEEEQYMVVTLKRNEDGSLGVSGGTNLQPFSTPREEDLRSTLPRSDGRRNLQRAAAKKIVNHNESNALEVLGLEYCWELGLLAVGLVRDDDGGCVHVSLYETKDLTLFKRLPPLYSWPQHMGTSHQCSGSTKGRYTMKKLTMSFNMDLISISMAYDDSTEDFFLLQLL